MHTLTKLDFELSQFRSHTLADRPASDSKPALTILPADMREDKEVKRFGLTFTSSFPVLFGSNAI